METKNNKLKKMIVLIDENEYNTFKKLVKLDDMDVSKTIRKFVRNYINENKDKLNKLF